MKKLIQGIVDFRKDLTEETRALFKKLATEQKPDALFVACSDSRVVPNLFASTNPGDLFVIRNVGNLIPPYSHCAQDSSALAAVEYALNHLNVADIIVCGHSECAAMQAITHGKESSCCPHLTAWLEHGEPAARRERYEGSISPALSQVNQVSQANVLLQLEHLKSYPIVNQRLENGSLRLHGWWFDIGHADVYCFEAGVNQFLLIDEKEAEWILSRLV